MANNSTADSAKIVGREPEIQKIHSILHSRDPELVAIWGRRRIGKTFLIRHGRAPVDDHFLEFTGQRNGARKVQLRHFVDALSKAFHQGLALNVPETWEDAFRQLEDSMNLMSYSTPCSAIQTSTKK